MKDKVGYMYIITNKYNTTTYIGVTSDIIRRIYEHKNKVVDGFSKTYNLNKLVYYEVCDDIITAIEREKQLKRWSKSKKHNLINSMNPSWQDLYESII